MRNSNVNSQTHTHCVKVLVYDLLCGLAHNSSYSNLLD